MDDIVCVRETVMDEVPVAVVEPEREAVPHDVTVTECKAEVVMFGDAECVAEASGVADATPDFVGVAKVDEVAVPERCGVDDEDAQSDALADDETVIMGEADETADGDEPVERVAQLEADTVAECEAEDVKVAEGDAEAQKVTVAVAMSDSEPVVVAEDDGDAVNEGKGELDPVEEGVDEAVFTVETVCVEHADVDEDCEAVTVMVDDPVADNDAFLDAVTVTVGVMVADVVTVGDCVRVASGDADIEEFTLVVGALDGVPVVEIVGEGDGEFEDVAVKELFWDGDAVPVVEKVTIVVDDAQLVEEGLGDSVGNWVDDCDGERVSVTESVRELVAVRGVAFTSETDGVGEADEVGE